MTFSDKLKILMEITQTSNKALAKYLIVDPSMISQLRTGARNVTKKNVHLRNMSTYFATNCQTQSKFVALKELIDSDELTNDCTVTELSDIIYRYLTADDLKTNSSSKIISEVFKENPRVRKSKLTPHELPDKSLMVCHNEDEKKTYMRKLFEYYLTLEKPGVIYFASEEVVDWIYNDKEFYNDFRSWCITIIEKGFSIIRIMKPMENREHFLKNQLMWLPVYLTGGVRLYYYPHFRDDIYRQTVIAMNNSASYFSSSLARTGTCYYSFVSTNPSLSSAYVTQLKDYLGLCRPSMYICKTEHDITSVFGKLMTLPGDRISKSFVLSPESIPYMEMVEYMSTSDNMEYRNAAKIASRLYNIETPTCQESSNIIDMCTLASPEDIIGGKVRLKLPGFVQQRTLYYDARLYAMHLRHILYLLNTNQNYHFYPISPSAFGDYSNDYAPITVVDNQAMMVVDESKILHFTQHDIIHTMYEHLYKQAQEFSKYQKSRREIMNMLIELLEKITEGTDF